ncbi:MAG: hypothetical protein K2H53_05610 [Clostridia bacterium]|nr:hypothetical protein [Clostridia bacterium]
MKIFMQKGFIRKLIVSIVCVILLNFCFAPNVQAKYGGEMTVLMREFATAIADVAATVVQMGVTGAWDFAVDSPGSGNPSGNDYWIKADKFRYPILQVSPELIFAGEIELLDVNFITPVNSRSHTIELKNDNGLKTLRSIVASWYVTLRTIAIVGLLSVLIYIGIRIIISSTSGEKAKYKQRLMDWVIAFCLLFFMHYIMAAAITVVDRVNDMLGKATGVFDGIPINSTYGTVKYEGESNSKYGLTEWTESYNDVSDIEAINLAKQRVGSGVINESGFVLQTAIQEPGTNNTIDTYVYTATFDEGTLSIIKTKRENAGVVSINYKAHFIPNSSLPTYEEKIVSEDGDRVMYFINYARLFLNVKDDDQYIPMSIAYLIIYIALVTLTAVFAIRYIKRVIYIAFLTMIAPMVALTYPLDKLKDRKSTGMGFVV